MGTGVCLLGYEKDNIEKVKGWDGFVSPEGIFYKVAERGDLSDAHDKFVDIFSLNKLNISLDDLYEKYRSQNSRYENIKFSYKDIFIHMLGYANVEHKQNGLEIEVPNPRVKGYKLTDAQIVTIAEIIKVNNDSMDDLNQVFQYDYDDDNSYTYTKKRRTNW